MTLVKVERRTTEREVVGSNHALHIGITSLRLSPLDRIVLEI